MLDLKLLSIEELEGKNQLEVIKKIGPKAAVTDYAILLGYYIKNEYGIPNEYLDNEDESLENRTGTYWTRTAAGFGNVYFMYDRGTICSLEPEIRFYGGRPMIDYSEIEDFITKKSINKYGVLEVEFGEYPGMVTDNVTAKKLEELYQNKALSKTKKKYTHDLTKWQDENIGFSEKKEIEYEYNGRKYIRFVANSNNSAILSNGKVIKEGDFYWLNVEPIVWYVDEDMDLAFTKKIIFSGIQYDEIKKYNGSFSSTNIKRFMDKYLAREIIATNYLEKDDSTSSIFDKATRELEQINPYTKVKKKNME